MSEVRWFISPIKTAVTEEGVTRRFPAMMDKYPCREWSGVFADNKTQALLRWVAPEPFEVDPTEGMEIITGTQWVEVYAANPEFRNCWKDQPPCMVI